MESKEPKVTLVGAGPGDADLITVKAIKALADADVVLYDALVNDDLLSYCPARTIKKFVGKRAGQHSFKQEEINELLVEHAFQYGHVVRLKGGDPFIFGRGQEEMSFVRSFGIPCNVVPGISSVYSVPAMQDIPLTSRGVSESFWVITGTTKSGALSKDLHLAAQSSATIVVLMGMRKIKEIVALFKRVGKENTPVAIVQNGSMPNERLGIGTISSIEKVVAREKLASPAVIVIGDVVNVLRNQSARKYLSAKQTVAA